MVNHARHALTALETQQSETRAQVDLFAVPPQAAAPEQSAVDKALGTIDPDALSPREALDALYRLKKLSSAA